MLADQRQEMCKYRDTKITKKNMHEKHGIAEMKATNIWGS